MYGDVLERSLILNKKIIGIVSLCVVISFCVLKSTSVSAAEVPLIAEEVFLEKEVRALQAKVANFPIYQDKNKNGNFSYISTRASGSYPRRKGVILVTDDKYKGIIPTGHVAIVYSYSEVIESLENGVVKGANDWDTSKDTCYGLSVVGTTVSEDKAAADWCYSQIGKPYNWNYFNTGTRDAFYCSQLVWAAFLDNFGIDLSTSAFGSAIHPSELIVSDKTNIIYEK